MKRRAPRSLVVLGSGLSALVAACAEPVPAPSNAASVERESAASGCTLAHKAPRMWVQLPDGASLADFDITAAAAQLVVMSIDRALCELAEPTAATSPEAPLDLRTRAIARHAFVVTHVHWHDGTLASASAALQPAEGATQAPTSRWLVTLQRGAQGYQISAWSTADAARTSSAPAADPTAR
jgi:hypothetical protein